MCSGVAPRGPHRLTCIPSARSARTAVALPARTPLKRSRLFFRCCMGFFFQDGWRPRQNVPAEHVERPRAVALHNPGHYSQTARDGLARGPRCSPRTTRPARMSVSFSLSLSLPLSRAIAPTSHKCPTRRPCAPADRPPRWGAQSAPLRTSVWWSQKLWTSSPYGRYSSPPLAVGVPRRSFSSSRTARGMPM